MVPANAFVVEEEQGKNGEDDQRDDFLNDFELQQGERTAVAHETVTVGRDLTRIFRQSQQPTDQNNDNERSIVCYDALFLQFHVTIPRKGHENI